MEQMKEMLEKAKLNWTVYSESIQTESGLVIPNKMALVKNDTKDVLGIHSPQYVPYQNEEMMDLLTKISQKTGLQLHSGGYFGKGERVWIQLKSDDQRMPGGDKIEGFISGFNSFDGGTSLAFGNSFITVSCRNTWWKGYREVQSRLRHSASMKPKIDEILKSIEVLLLEEKGTFEEVKHLQDFRMDEATINMVTKRLFEMKKEETLDQLSSVKLNKVGLFYSDLEMETSTKGDNLWGLFSGVTRYTTHSMKKTGDNNEAKIFGSVGRREQEIYADLLQLTV
jgi:phage/plasmid-like protein (TIGR03299 family)